MCNFGDLWIRHPPSIVVNIKSWVKWIDEARKNRREKSKQIGSLGIHLEDLEAFPGTVLQDLVSAPPMRRTLGQPQPSTSIFDPTR